MYFLSSGVKGLMPTLTPVGPHSQSHANFSDTITLNMQTSTSATKEKSMNNNTFLIFHTKAQHGNKVCQNTFSLWFKTLSCLETEKLSQSQEQEQLMFLVSIHIRCSQIQTPGNKILDLPKQNTCLLSATPEGCTSKGLKLCLFIRLVNALHYSSIHVDWKSLWVIHDVWEYNNIISEYDIKLVVVHLSEASSAPTLKMTQCFKWAIGTVHLKLNQIVLWSLVVRVLIMKRQWTQLHVFWWKHEYSTVRGGS